MYILLCTKYFLVRQFDETNNRNVFCRSDREKSPSDLRQKVARKRDKRGSESESDGEKVSFTNWPLIN